MNTREKPQWKSIAIRRLAKDILWPTEQKSKRLITDFEKNEKERNEDKEKTEKFWSEFYNK